MVTIALVAVLSFTGCTAPSGGSSYYGSRAADQAASTPQQPGQSYVAPPSVASGHSAAAPALLADPTDEVWIIAAPPRRDAGSTTTSPPTDDATPGSGAMLAVTDSPAAASQGRSASLNDYPADMVPQGKTLVPLPLQHTDVQARVTGYVASVEVTQQFHNPFDTKIEAVYVFPLPQDAAVSDFVMTIGERKIRGIIREKHEAQQLYAAARAQGYRAALLTQIRPNIFAQNVANIEPGKGIDVTITYFNTVAYHDGQYVFNFPMVVGPRFNPPSTADPIAPVARTASPMPGTAGTRVPYLAPGERSGHDIALTLTLDPGVPVREINSISHDITRDTTDVGLPRLTLTPHDTVPNKDFVLTYAVEGDRIQSGLATHVGEDGQGTFTLMLHPPADLKNLSRQAMEMVFVIDCSGSMSGEPLQQAKAAIDHALQNLRPGDSFQIIRFSNDASSLGSSPLEVSPQSIRQARRYLQRLRGQGGTMMIEGIKAALEFPVIPSATVW